MLYGKCRRSKKDSNKCARFGNREMNSKMDEHAGIRKIQVIDDHTLFPELPFLFCSLV